jgi:mannose-1-phosphate guanylyltransferase/mannose-6-phosphate isomerase
MIPVILAGGVGSRLWPASRNLFPKQFLNLVDDQYSLFQKTLLRLQEMGYVESPIIICNEEHRFLVSNQLEKINVKARSIILEPFGRNTAPAISLAVLTIPEDSNKNLLILPADHNIENLEQFKASLKAAANLCSMDKLVTFGIVPSHAETGYGYLKIGKKIDSTDGFSLNGFVEKPDKSTAEQFLKSEKYLWNSGMFVFPSNLIKDQLKLYAPDIFKISKSALDNANTDLEFLRIDEKHFSKCPSDSIDYAVMEKTDNAVIVPLNAQWNDIGSWDSLYDFKEKDKNNNCIVGDVVARNTEDCLIHSQSKLITTIGVNNLIIVETPDAVLIANKSDSQSVKELVDKLKELKRPEVEQHSRVYRPWGWYESVCAAERFQVKRILVNPGATLSLQLHHHRAEHWVVVKGTAEVTNGKEIKIYSEDQSTYIPLGTQHRLANPGSIPLEIIEVQTGSYLGEDDIVRFEDIYGR